MTTKTVVATGLTVTLNGAPLSAHVADITATRSEEGKDTLVATITGTAADGTPCTLTLSESSLLALSKAAMTLRADLTTKKAAVATGVVIGAAMHTGKQMLGGLWEKVRPTQEAAPPTTTVAEATQPSGEKAADEAEVTAATENGAPVEDDTKQAA